MLAALVRGLRDDGLPVLIHVDGATGEAIDAALLDDLAMVPGLTLLQAPRNAGLGAGLNRLAETALAAGYDRLAMFDQDSSPPAGMVRALSLRLDRLTSAGVPAAAIGPRPVAPAGETTKPPRYRRGQAVAGVAKTVATDFIITSGSLVDLRVYEAVGPFREDYRIDAIDTEWCFRAAARGWQVFLAEDVEMPHRVGAGTIRIGPLAFPRQSPARMETYVRNQMHGLRLPHVPLRWKLRMMTYIPLQSIAYALSGDDRIATAWRLVRAAADGFAGRLGRPR